MRLLAPLLGSLACTANVPAEQPPPAIEAPDDPDNLLKLERGELLRIRGTGGACGGDSQMVVHEDGRFDLTTQEGCKMGRPTSANRPPPKPLYPGAPPTTFPDVKAGQLNPADLAQLQALLADPALPHTLESIKGGSSSAHPNRLEFLVRTPTGEAHGEYIGHRLRERSPFHAFVDSLYARL